MSVDLLYVTHNRLEYARASFEALRKNTNWELVDRLHIRDDNSTDGTAEFLLAAIGDFPVAVELHIDNYGGPVAAMNDALDVCDASVLAKIDNDLIVCPRWLEVMLSTLMHYPNVNVLGMEPGFGGAVQPVDRRRAARRASHVGGIGLFRTSIFRHRRPRLDNRFFGWTQFQRQHARSAWIAPALPCFLLDHIDLEPWKTLAAYYIDQGWSRAWNEYYVAGPEYYGWWLRDQVAVA